ncbi:MAG: twin-arginine translocase subunit TatC [Actinobacteria bacterium]|nr:twin-arginine translocase subunit TatC [Actinomycetota bacterium]
MAVIPRRRRRRERSGDMSLVEHLGELRKRLVISALAIVGGSLAGWFLYWPVFRLLTNPFCDFMRSHPQFARDPKDPCDLAIFSITEAFVLRLKLTLFLGLLIALPVVLYQLWAFITPGLTERERKFSLPFVFISVLLFALGGWFAFFTLPRGLNFLLGFAGDQRIEVVLSIGKYVGFVMLIVLAFGASFEFPIVLISLTMVGVLTSRQLRDWRRYVLLVIAVFAAVITPSADPFTMIAMMIPLLIFYELAILFSRIMKR